MVTARAWFRSILLIFAIFDRTFASNGIRHSSSVKTSLRKIGKQANSTTTTNNPFHSPSGKACSFYIWNAPSAALHSICHFLQKDCTYEGKGGRKFIYIRPGSLLQLLHPHCPRSKHTCLICGGTYRDHMTLAWGKHLYRPFDLHLDRTFRFGYRTKENMLTGSCNGKETRTSGNTQQLPIRNEIQLTFHRQYIQDVTERLKNIIAKEDQTKAMKESTENISRIAVRTITVLPSKRMYVVPADEPEIKNILFPFVRAILLNRINTLIDIEHMEEEELNRRVVPKKFISKNQVAQKIDVIIA